MSSPAAWGWPGVCVFACALEKARGPRVSYFSSDLLRCLAYATRQYCAHSDVAPSLQYVRSPVTSVFRGDPVRGFVFRLFLLLKGFGCVLFFFLAFGTRRLRSVFFFAAMSIVYCLCFFPRLRWAVPSRALGFLR